MLELDTEWHDLRASPEWCSDLDPNGKSHQAEILAEILQAGWEELGEINAALARMDNGTYGICLASGAPIAYERLRAEPWTPYCTEYARAMEEQQSKSVAEEFARPPDETC